MLYGKDQYPFVALRKCMFNTNICFLFINCVILLPLVLMIMLNAQLYLQTLKMYCERVLLCNGYVLPAESVQFLIHMLQFILNFQAIRK